jgi:serine/threonine protein kinase
MPEPTPLTPSPYDQPTLPSGPPVPVSDAVTLHVPTPGAPADPAPPCQFFGEYELLAEVGRGGMGIVYRARHTSLNRVVALKMILPGAGLSREDLQRFHTEAESTAQLRHPNIVSLHAVGEIDGRHFYSMDFIDGASLSQRLAAGPLCGRLAARYLATVARAIHHAHRQGILHRDLKPSNILLDADDQPHVTDFGLAKKLGADSGQTRTGQVMGTPSYMSPEQANGRIHELGPPCDVYGLGAILYELLTGRPPFCSDTPLDTLRHVLERDPAPPRLLNPKVERDLEAICLKCLEKDPRRRYASAEALAGDLDNYLSGNSIRASTFNLFDQLARTLDRSHHDVEFRRYGNLMFFLAAIVFVEHLVVFLLTWTGPPYPTRWILLSRVGQLGLMGVIFWVYRARRLYPTSMAERQLWSLVLGYLLASALSVVVYRLTAPAEPPPGDLAELKLFPTWSLLSGMALFVLGSSYWGRCYVFSAAFFVVALVMPFHLHWAPLEFGLLWTAILAAIGWHLRHLARTAPPEKPDG